MQIKVGTVAVASGSNVVTGTGVDWSQVLVGNYIIITGLSFEIASIDLVTDPTHPTLTLTEHWPGSTASGLTYVIQRDFTSQFRLPLLNAGDLEAAAIFTRAMMIIDGYLGIAGSTTNEIIITQPGHTFVVGNCLRFDGADWVRSSAASSSSSIIVGMVSYVDPDGVTLRIKTDGYVSGLSGLTAGTVYFLKNSSSSPNITAVVPGETGSLKIPVFIATSSTSGYLLNLATAQAGEFGLGTPGLVPAPPTVDGTLFLRDDGWHSVIVSEDSINLSHLEKPSVLTTWHDGVNWADWFDNEGDLSVWSHMNDLHFRLSVVENNVGNIPYTRLVYTRKNVFFASGDNATVDLVIGDNVEEIIVTLISGYVIGYGLVAGSPTYYYPIGCVTAKILLDTSTNKNLHIGLGTSPNWSASSPLGKAFIEVEIGGEYLTVAQVDMSGLGACVLAGPSLGVSLGQIYMSRAGNLNSLYRSVAKDSSVGESSWALHFSSGTSIPIGKADPFVPVESALAKIPNIFDFTIGGHCGAVVVEYGVGAVFGVI